MFRSASIACVAVYAGIATAHDGHGVNSSHWHGGDLLGVAVLALAVGALVRWRRSK
jgi:hypothetical protein